MIFDTLISTRDLSEIASDPRTVAIDCRFSLMDPDKGRQDYEEGHIPGAVYADLDADLAGPVTADSGRHPLPDENAFVETLRAWGVSNDSQVVAYDDGSGAIAARLWWLLKWLGHPAVAVLDGGFAAWQASGLPIGDAQEKPVAGRFEGSANVEMTISSGEVAEKLESIEGFILVDARDGERFRGEVEPIDPIAGHVPGALNLPFSLAVDENGAWRTPEDLAALWDGLVPVQAKHDWGVMCGSGVTACHLALSAEIAGRPAPRLYVDSWSGWLRNPGRPIAGCGG